MCCWGPLMGNLSPQNALQGAQTKMKNDENLPGGTERIQLTPSRWGISDLPSRLIYIFLHVWPLHYLMACGLLNCCRGFWQHVEDLLGGMERTQHPTHPILMRDHWLALQAYQCFLHVWPLHYLMACALPGCYCVLNCCRGFRQHVELIQWYGTAQNTAFPTGLTVKVA